MLHGADTMPGILQRGLDILIVITLTLAVGDKLVPNALVKVLAVYCSLLAVVVFPLFKMYSSWQKVLILRQLRTLAMAWFTVLVAFNVILILLSNEAQLRILAPLGLFTSAGFNSWALLVFCGLAMVRVILHQTMVIARSRGFNQQTAIILGAGQTGRTLAQYLQDNQGLGIVTAGFFDDQIPTGNIIKTDTAALGAVLGAIDGCHDYLKHNSVDFVFIALPMRAEEKITRIIGTLGTSGHAVQMVQDLLSFGIQKARTQQLGQLQVMDFYLFPLWKKIFDIVFSLMIVLTTFPLWIGIMLAIKWEDGGPVFFRHPRVMEGGKRFHCIKFRSMQVNAQDRLEPLLEKNPALQRQWGQYFKLKSDPRVTKVGALLRKLNLDELPQFLNVLLGQMSVVGARPVVPEELEKYYRQVTLTYCAMKPGITGPWQVNKQKDSLDYADRVELDRQYILNCTIWLDLMIMAKTIYQTIFAIFPSGRKSQRG